MGNGEGQPPRPGEGDGAAGWRRWVWRSPLIWLVLALVGVLLLQHRLANTGFRTVAYSEFKKAIGEGRFDDVLLSAEWLQGAPKGKASGGADQHGAASWRARRVPQDKELVPLLERKAVRYRWMPTADYSWLWLWIVPFVLLIFWLIVLRRMSGSMRQAGGLVSFGKSRARVAMQADTGVTFADVAGVEEAVEEVQEVVEFLQSPHKFRRLGAKIPKGVLLVGPPGTGKTLLARAVAGEAKVPFFSLSGSEFVEMFVGVGAARVRDLFQQAQAKAPCIIFIDELDALGKARASGQVPGGGHEEREQTLNQLLAEMDGFDPRVGLIVLSATNRPEVLDPALLRPGRFDRHILVDRPDKRGRQEILALHVREVRLADDVELDQIAATTPGFSGADLANLVNEAALLAGRREADAVQMSDFSAAVERIIAGLKKKKRQISEREKRIIAYHEAGHALAGMTLEHAEPVHKVSIVPHGLEALGYTMQLPAEDRYLLTEHELRDKMAGLLAGRAAEEVVFGAVTSGASNDLQRATELAQRMVCEFGMSSVVGPLGLGPRQRSAFLDDGAFPMVFGERRFSEHTAQSIDEEVKGLVERQLERARDVCAEQRPLLDAIATRLLEQEVLERDELEQLAAKVRD